MAEAQDGAETRLTWDQALALPQVLATSAGERDVYGLERIGVLQDGAWYYPQADALGSVRQWSDAEGTVLGLQAYGPYGEALESLGPSVAPWGYTGEWQDPAGLVYLRARWYNGALGRFTQVDPLLGVLSVPGTQHPYAYGLDNPLRYLDPSGRYIFEESPADPWHVGSASIRSRYWYTQPGWQPRQPGSLEIIAVFSLPAAAAVPSMLVETGAALATAGLYVYDALIMPALLRLYIAVSIFLSSAGGGGSCPPQPQVSTWPGPENGRQVIGGLEYSMHALERMMPWFNGGRGIPPSVVQNAVEFGVIVPGKYPDTVMHIYDNVLVVTDMLSKVVITVFKTGN